MVLTAHIDLEHRFAFFIEEREEVAFASHEGKRDETDRLHGVRLQVTAKRGTVEDVVVAHSVLPFRELAAHFDHVSEMLKEERGGGPGAGRAPDSSNFDPSA